MKNIDYEYTREIVCPYCGYMQGDSWEWNMNEADDWDECECDNCGKIFFAVRNIDVSYSSAKNPGGVIMAQHEPTTEEIVNALRTCEDQVRISHKSTRRRPPRTAPAGKRRTHRSRRTRRGST